MAAIAAALAGPASAGASGKDCDAILPPTRLPTGSRSLIPEDLVRLRDIGPVDPEPFAAPFFTISPDRTRVAFQLRRANPADNRYCLAMVVMGLKQGSRPRIVDQGGDLQLLAIDLRGAGDFPTGITSVVTPRWSSDGRWIAFLKRERGTTQVWKAMADGGGSVQLTHSAVDVQEFEIAKGGSAIVYSTRPSLEQARRQFEQEGLGGFHYDGRFSPFASDLPFPTSPVERQVHALDLASGTVRDAEPAEAATIAGDSQLIATAGAPARPDVRSSNPLARAWITATGLSGGAQRGSLHARSAGGRTWTCTKPVCEGALEPWWVPGERSVRFLRREGWARASTAIYEWSPASGTVRRLYLTDDVLADCAPDVRTLICLVDSSLQPRRLVRLDPASGKRLLLFDPNPEFAGLTLGEVRRLKWRNAFGLETLADLVLPVGYRKGRRYPMIVVQYDTRGFVRGGTGDEYPIQAFANRGYAVLSLRRPEAIGDAKGAKDFTQGRKLNLLGFADRRSVDSSLQSGVRLAVEQGLADPERIGITGLSDGASTVTWSLIHGGPFKAAAMSTCCIDTSLAMRVGPAAAKDFARVGYPGVLGRDDPFWKDLSLSLNARRVRTPILLQLADDEYLNSLESYTALREAGAPVDLFLFPGEHHVKWQPAHRLAIYRRSIDWFDYWLRGIRSTASERQADLSRWDELRSTTDGSSRSPPQ